MSEIRSTKTIGKLRQAMPARLARPIDSILSRVTGRTAKKSPWQHETPTTSIYFSDVFRDHISDVITSTKPIHRLEPNVFRVRGSSDTTIIFRYLSKPLLESLRRDRNRRVVYVLDDDFQAARNDMNLPEDYRTRLALLQKEIVSPLCAIVDELIAPSQNILDAMPVAKRTLIAPSFIHSVPDLSHHADAKTVDIVFNGSRSHVGDLDLITPALLKVLADNPQARLTTFLGKYAPRQLQGQQINHLQPLRWEEYRKFLHRTRFHIALGPARQTHFNSARSPTRIMDNAGFGAAGIYSKRHPFDQWIVDGKSGLLVDDSITSWTQGIQSLVSNAAARQSVASNGIALAKQIGSHETARKFWCDKLGLHMEH